MTNHSFWEEEAFRCLYYPEKQPPFCTEPWCEAATQQSHAHTGAGSEQTTQLICLDFVIICKPRHSHLLIITHDKCYIALCQVSFAASTQMEQQGISKKGVRLLYSNDRKRTGKGLSKVMSHIPLKLTNHSIALLLSRQNGYNGKKKNVTKTAIKQSYKNGITKWVENKTHFVISPRRTTLKMPHHK